MCKKKITSASSWSKPLIKGATLKERNLLLMGANSLFKSIGAMTIEKQSLKVLKFSNRQN